MINLLTRPRNKTLTRRFRRALCLEVDLVRNGMFMLSFDLERALYTQHGSSLISAMGCDGDACSAAGDTAQLTFWVAVLSTRRVVFWNFPKHQYKNVLAWGKFKCALVVRMKGGARKHGTKSSQKTIILVISYARLTEIWLIVHAASRWRCKYTSCVQLMKLSWNDSTLVGPFYRSERATFGVLVIRSQRVR